MEQKESFLGKTLRRLRPQENPPKNRGDIARRLGERWEFFRNYPTLPPGQANPNKLGLLWAVASLRALGEIEKWVESQPAFDDDGNELPEYKGFYIRKVDPTNPPPKWGFKIAISITIYAIAKIVMFLFFLLHLHPPLHFKHLLNFF